LRVTVRPLRPFDFHLIRPFVAAASLLALAAGVAAQTPVDEAGLGRDLNGVLQYLEARNPELRAMALEADAAQQRLGPAGALPDPMFGIELRDIPVSDPTLSPALAGSTRYALRQMFPLGDKRGLRRGVAEAEVSAAEARRRGVTRILVTHPELPFVDLDVDTQRELARAGALFERCWQSVSGRSATTPFARIVSDIRAVGRDSTVLATDFGQPENPPPARGFADYVESLSRAGFGDADVERMACANAAALLGLDAA
jgi:hypothetical protein